MVRSLFLLLVYFTIIGLGFSAPFAMMLGYVWVDIFRPGDVIFPVLRVVPLAMLMGLGAVGAYFALDRRAPPRIGAVIVLTVILSVWVTLTTFWAVAPDAAWAKWDWAAKTVLFSAFIPFAIRNRNHIEAFLAVYIFSLMGNIIPFGAKAILTGGGGYKRLGLGLIKDNTFLGQSEILGMAAVSAIPIIVFLMKHGRIMPRNLFTVTGYLGLMVLCLATVIGTHARTALVGLFVLAIAMFVTTKRKFSYMVICLATAGAIFATAPASWFERMSTITTNSADMDNSESVRLLVWKWTLDFVMTHPFGGGFEAYYGNQIVLEVNEEKGIAKVEDDRAFHSSYFEVLGEHGWFGLGLFLSLLLLTVLSLYQTVRRTRGHPQLAWAYDLAWALLSSLAVDAACGAFTSIAFQPFFYYWFAISYCLREYIRRVQEAPVPLAVETKPAFALAR